MQPTYQLSPNSWLVPYYLSIFQLGNGRTMPTNCCVTDSLLKCLFAATCWRLGAACADFVVQFVPTKSRADEPLWFFWHLPPIVCVKSRWISSENYTATILQNFTAAKNRPKTFLSVFTRIFPIKKKELSLLWLWRCKTRHRYRTQRSTV